MIRIAILGVLSVLCLAACVYGELGDDASRDVYQRAPASSSAEPPPAEPPEGVAEASPPDFSSAAPAPPCGGVFTPVGKPCSPGTPPTAAASAPTEAAPSALDDPEYDVLFNRICTSPNQESACRAFNACVANVPYRPMEARRERIRSCCVSAFGANSCR